MSPAGVQAECVYVACVYSVRVCVYVRARKRSLMTHGV